MLEEYAVGLLAGVSGYTCAHFIVEGGVFRGAAARTWSGDGAVCVHSRAAVRAALRLPPSSAASLRSLTATSSLSPASVPSCGCRADRLSAPAPPVRAKHPEEYTSSRRYCRAPNAIQEACSTA